MVHPRNTNVLRPNPSLSEFAQRPDRVGERNEGVAVSVDEEGLGVRGSEGVGTDEGLDASGEGFEVSLERGELLRSRGGERIVLPLALEPFDSLSEEQVEDDSLFDGPVPEPVKGEKKGGGVFSCWTLS